MSKEKEVLTAASSVVSATDARKESEESLKRSLEATRKSIGDAIAEANKRGHFYCTFTGGDSHPIIISELIHQGYRVDSTAGGFMLTWY